MAILRNKRLPVVATVCLTVASLTTIAGAAAPGSDDPKAFRDLVGRPVPLGEPGASSGVRSASAPSDPYYAAQWNLQPLGAGNLGSANVEPAWDLARGAGVRVAVLSTGVRVGGPDLEAARVLPGYDFVDDDAFPDDEHGEGTFLASVVAQTLSNGIGGAGVAPDALIMPVRVLDHHASGSDEMLVDGMSWARDNGADVILVDQSMSDPPTDYSADVCVYVHEIAKTVPIVAAAGDYEPNDTERATKYPAACDLGSSGFPARDDVIGVGSVDRAGFVSQFSAADRVVDITAPGGELLRDAQGFPTGLADHIVGETFDDFLSIQTWSTFGAVSTSYAAAHVAGVAALVRGVSRFVDVQGILLGTSRDLPDPLETDFGVPTTTTTTVPATTTTASGPSGPTGTTTTAVPTTTLPPAPLFDNRGVDAHLSVLVAFASAPNIGYRLVAGDGGIFSFGQSGYFGSMGGKRLNRPMVGIDRTPSDQGYWTVASDGGIFSFGDAKFYGSTGGMRLVRPIVGMAATPTGKGYWLVASDGGIFAFGDAKFFGSMGGLPLARPVVGMAVTPTGKGYWLVADDGGMFAFGDAAFFGSMGGFPLAQPIVGMAARPTGGGYWLVARDGGIFSFGDAKFYGGANVRGPDYPITGMAATNAGDGYWVVAQDATVYAFGGAPFFGPTLPLNLFEEVVAIAPS